MEILKIYTYNDSEEKPVEKLFFNERIKIIKNGQFHIAILTENNELYVCGENYSGQIGFSDEIKRPIFTKVTDLNLEIKNLECGRECTALVDIKNSIYLTGDFSQITYDTFTKIITNEDIKGSSIKFIRFSFNNLFIVTKENKIYKAEKDCRTVNLLKRFWNKIKDLQCGKIHCIILTKNGNIYGYGKNNYGQLGLNENLKTLTKLVKINLDFKVKKISCYSEGSLILNEFNELYGCGRKRFNELGNLNNEIVYSFTKIITNVKNIFTSFENKNVITTLNNKIYVTGDFEKIYGLNIENYKTIGISKLYFVNEFTELEWVKINDNCNIHILIQFDFIWILYGNYFVNGRKDYWNEIVNSLGINCLQKKNYFIYTDIEISLLSH